MSDARPKRTRQRAARKAAAPGLSPERREAAEALIGHRFRNGELLDRAMTHSSAVGTSEAVQLSNQRLEFLGDRVLNLLIAERLLDRRRMESEGDLAPRLNRLVRKSACADAMRHLRLADFLIVSESEAAHGGRTRESTLGDACEALIAAIYLDGGLAAARRFVERAWAPQFAEPIGNSKDPKTRLQEWAQGRGHPLPEYAIKSRSGPDHAPIYEVEVRVAKDSSATATGASKREAEREAAARLLSLLTGGVE